MMDGCQLVAKCEDHLTGNARLYAHKARRKKIALIHVELSNANSKPINLDLDSVRLSAGEKEHSPASPDLIIRKFSEFTWDFLLFAILDFHPILIAMDLLILLVGPLYNRRLKKQLRHLTDGRITLDPGERRTLLLGFRKVKAKPKLLKIPHRCEGNETALVECEIE